jgi:hypothetical protein
MLESGLNSSDSSLDSVRRGISNWIGIASNRSILTDWHWIVFLINLAHVLFSREEFSAIILSWLREIDAIVYRIIFLCCGIGKLKFDLVILYFFS